MPSSSSPSRWPGWSDYAPPFHCLGGTARRVLVDVSGQPCADL
ncbi:hypothetical protein OHT93_02090 [Streptomyces sp. NBC_00191]